MRRGSGMANGIKPAAGARGPQPVPGRPVTEARPSHPPAPRGRHLGRKLRRHLWRWGLPALLVAALFLPYPYHAGGAFQLVPSQRVEVRSEVEGLVEEVFVREGDWIEAGQPIARLASRVHEKNLKATVAQLETARSQLDLLRAGAKPEEVARAEAAVRTAETALAWSRPRAERYGELFKDRMISEQEHENAIRQRDLDWARLQEAKAELKVVKSGARSQQVKAMEAQVRSLQALVDNYKTDVERTTLAAPIAGSIVTPRVEELTGTYLKPGQRDLVVQIEDSRTMRAEVEVPEEDVAGVRPGSRVKVVTWAFHDRTFEGTVLSIAPIAAANAADAASSTVLGQAQGSGPMAMSSSTYRIVRVTTEIPNPEGRLKSEMTGYAKIETGSRPVWDVLFRPLLRWVMVEVWYWIP